jgi:PAS domain S-box-containing protein
MIALCTYCLDKLSATEIIDVISNHEFVLIKQNGNWETIENFRYKNTKSSLIENEKRFRSALKNTPISVAAQDKDLKFLWAYNQRTAQMEEIIGKTDFDLFPKNEAERLNGLKRQVMETGKPVNEKMWITSNGKRLYLDIFFEPIRNDQGIITGIETVTVDLTSQKLLEEKLAYLASFPAINPMQVIEIDITGKMKYYNDSTTKLFPDIVEKSIQHPYLKGLIDIVRNHLLTNAAYFTREVEVNNHFYEQVVYIVGDGKDIRIYGHDISEHKQAEGLLRETSNYLNNLLDYANAPIIVWDPHFRISRFNPAFERLTGYKSQDVLGLGLDILFPENKKTDSLQQIYRTLSGERWEIVEIPILRVDGELRTVLWNSANVYDNDGKTIMATIAQGQDITERKIAEEAIKTSETKYRRLFEAAKDGILLLDAETGVILDVNPFLVEMLGLPYKEFLGKSLWELGYFKDIIANKTNFLKLQSKKYIRYEDLPLRTVDGREMKVEFVSNMYEVDHKKIIQCNVRDITKRKIAEEEVYKLNEILKRRAGELEVANKELEAFAYSVSHDLRAPLRSMEGFSQALLEDCFDTLNDECKDYLRRIQSSAELMAQLIDDMLRLSRITRADMIIENVNLTEMAQKVAVILKNSAPTRNVKINITTGLIVRGDEKLIAIMLDNLFENAWKFTSKTPEAFIKFGITEFNGQKAYYISDNGVGFDMTYADKLFKPFQRLHSAGEFPGTGIGLASVQRVVQRHGGRVWAESKLGKGATFYFTLGLDK